MNLHVHRRTSRMLKPAVLSLAGLGTSMLLAACGSPAHPAAQQTALSPGPGQSLAGTPGSTATGPLTAPTAMPGMTMSPPAQSGSAASAPAPVGGDTVAIKGFAFAPAALVVQAGTTVTWTNRDADAHTVTSQGTGGPLKSAALSTGQSYSYTFTTPGTYAYLCTIHPFMTATVTVTK
ncbi:plastocyanin/azurin family copper-binding protein [Streptomyces sp. NBC_00212]|uniref:cupredoxin domain-containing protein n=1 Tax=Streptomyces sp. NBC_00212 TaxID=2975684 RepID=UPI00324C8817